MRLYLSSHRVGNEPATLRALVGSGTRAVIVMNACDAFEDRLKAWPREKTDIIALGFEVVELDLRTYFGDPAGLREQLSSIDLLWVVGGNAFVLARAMRASGFADVATELLRNDAFVYAGYSAGACVTTPGFEGIELMDDPDVLPDGYPDDGRAPTLEWVPWRIVPHWNSDHPESPDADRAVAFLLQAELPFRTLRDGHAIVIDGSGDRVVGRPTS